MYLEDFVDLSFAESDLNRMFSTSQANLWLAIEQFGMVLDDDCPGVSLRGYWDDPDVDMDGSWYFPGDLVDCVYIDLDNPPSEDVAWDAKSIQS